MILLIIAELEGYPTSLTSILSTLYHDPSILKNISKSDQRHLVSRVLNLARSHDEYQRWCGINLIRVLGRSYNILITDGKVMVSTLIKIVERHNSRSRFEVLKAAIESLNDLFSQIRGKPSLTREILTPRLPEVINLYLSQMDKLPYLILKSMKSILLSHPTTFRPFGNKLRVKITSLLSSNFSKGLPEGFFSLAASILPALVVIEREEPGDKWHRDVIDLVGQTVKVLKIYSEFININQDEELMQLISRLPRTTENDMLAINLPRLEIDFNKPETVLDISYRIELLLKVLTAFLTTETQFIAKVPVGVLVCLIEAICSINLKFAPFKFDIRDTSIRNIISVSIERNQYNAVKFLGLLPESLGGVMIPYIPAAISMLDSLIPHEKKSVLTEKVLANEILMCEISSTAEKYVSLVNNFEISSQFEKLIEMSLILVEKRRDLNTAGGNPSSSSNKSGASTQNGKKKRNNVRQQSVASSDILSHQHLFNETISENTERSIRNFFSVILGRTEVPASFQNLIMRYSIREALEIRGRYDGNCMPENLHAILIKAVLFPNSKSPSVLPIIYNLLKFDPTLSVLANPRIPPLPIHYQAKAQESGHNKLEEEEEEEEEEDHDEEEERKDEANVNVVVEHQNNDDKAQNLIEHSEYFVDSPLESESVSNRVYGTSVDTDYSLKRDGTTVEETDMQTFIQPALKRSKLFSHADDLEDQANLTHFKEKRGEVENGLTDAETLTSPTLEGPAEELATTTISTKENHQTYNKSNNTNQVSSEDEEFELPMIDVNEDSEEESE